MYSKRSPPTGPAGMELPYISMPTSWGMAPSTGISLLRRYSSIVSSTWGVTIRTTPRCGSPVHNLGQWAQLNYTEAWRGHRAVNPVPPHPPALDLAVQKRDSGKLVGIIHRSQHRAGLLTKHYGCELTSSSR